jgi:hypothetical protein
VGAVSSGARTDESAWRMLYGVATEQGSRDVTVLGKKKTLPHATSTLHVSKSYE